jgi:hypothetical protein
MAEKENKTNRQRLNERLSKRYPEDVYEGEGAMDEEAYFGRLNEFADERDADLEGYRKNDEEMRNLLQKDPTLAAFISDSANGKHPIRSIVERVGKDGFNAMLEDPETAKLIEEADKSYLERVAKEKSLSDEYEANLAESMNRLEKMQTERGLTDAQAEEAMKLVTDIVDEVIMGKFTERTLDMALNAINHDSDVANAREEGEIAGRNKKIKTELRKPTQGDVPMLGGGGRGLAPEEPKKKGYLDDIIQRRKF